MWAAILFSTGKCSGAPCRCFHFCSASASVAASVPFLLSCLCLHHRLCSVALPCYAGALVWWTVSVAAAAARTLTALKSQEMKRNEMKWKRPWKASRNGEWGTVEHGRQTCKNERTRMVHKRNQKRRHDTTRHTANIDNCFWKLKLTDDEKMAKPKRLYYSGRMETILYCIPFHSVRWIIFICEFCQSVGRSVAVKVNDCLSLLTDYSTNYSTNYSFNRLFYRLFYQPFYQLFNQLFN